MARVRGVNRVNLDPIEAGLGSTSPTGYAFAIVPTCPKCGEPIAPGPKGMVWGFQYDVDANGEWVSGSERGAFFHQTCWDKVKDLLPEGIQGPPQPG